MRIEPAGLACVCVLAVAGAASGWHGPGHELATKTAAAALPAEMPAFFIRGAGTVAHCSRDPDLFRELRDPPAIRSAEVPEHYFDCELLDGAEPPPTRPEFVELCARKGLQPAKVGFVLYSVPEWTQRLTVAFAEHRRWPDNVDIQRKCLVYAGLLSHYAQDLCMPLHTTIHYNGRADPDGSSPKTGIHQKADALLQKLPCTPAEAAKGVRVAAFEDLTAAVRSRFRESHALVDRVYELEGRLPGLSEPLGDDPELLAFAEGRLRAAASFTASLYLTAWRESGAFALPDWHQRTDSRLKAAVAPSWRRRAAFLAAAVAVASAVLAIVLACNRRVRAPRP